MASKPTGESDRDGEGALSYFDCDYCGASERSTAVQYGRFGYPRCPVCLRADGP